MLTYVNCFRETEENPSNVNEKLVKISVLLQKNNMAFLRRFVHKKLPCLLS